MTLRLLISLGLKYRIPSKIIGSPWWYNLPLVNIHQHGIISELSSITTTYLNNTSGNFQIITGSNCFSSLTKWLGGSITINGTPQNVLLRDVIAILFLNLKGTLLFKETRWRNLIFALYLPSWLNLT